MKDLEKYLDDIFEDIANQEDAVYEVCYRAYEMLSADDILETKSTAYEVLARRVHQTLVESNAYAGDLLQFRFFRLIGTDIVVVINSYNQEEDYSETTGHAHAF